MFKKYRIIFCARTRTPVGTRSFGVTGAIAGGQRRRNNGLDLTGDLA